VECLQSALCPVRKPLRKVHEGILRLLSGISIADLSGEDLQFSAIQAMVANIQPPRMGSETP
jgi:hypothetical protein